MADRIPVALAGHGKLGKVLAPAIASAPDLELVGICSRTVGSDRALLPSGQSVPLSSNLASLIETTQPRVLVDATVPAAVSGNVRVALAGGVSPVVATTGLTPPQLEEIRQWCAEREVGAVVAPNFALGAVLLMHLSQICARFFDCAEIIELHHDQKADAPSGTALQTARLMATARGGELRRPETATFTLPDVRGGVAGGVTIHSVRLPGLVAHQEVIFGSLGQTLTLRHDSTSRESFVPGVLLAIRHVVQSRELTVGLDKLLGL